MLSRKAVIRLTTLVSIIAWVTMVFTELSIVFSNKIDMNSGIADSIPKIALSVFILSLFVFFKYRIEKAESVNFIDLLWKVFVTGLITTIVSLVFRLFLILLGSTKLAENVLFQEFIYLINLGLLASFLISTFIVWKRLILYQKSKFLLTVWQIFEYALLISLLYVVLPVPAIANLERYYMGILVLLGIFLSANMKWVAYLNFKQKWKSILLILLAMFYLGYFAFTVFSFADDIGKNTPVFLNIGNNIFLISLMIFIFIYSLFSLLVILFNLPTSSVFEQKLEEVVNFQRLSQSIQTEQNEERVYDILLESATSTVFADAAWIEIFEQEGNSKFYTHKISVAEVGTIKEHISNNKISGVLEPSSDKSKNANKYLSTLRSSRFRSIMAFPIYVKNSHVGTLALLKDVSDGFNKEMSKIIDTFTNQAGISIENFRLLSEALENERYKEELKIAKRVQSSLLPKVLDHGQDYDMIAFSEAADEVGGDYYDTFRINQDKIALIISDVSGKGTSAAFHMSQMKGVFHSFAQLDLPPKEFLVKANTALSRCLDKTSFITTSYFVIDSEQQKVEFARAGHCPTLYYDSQTGKASYFQNKGLGLGIIRNNEFGNYIQTNCFQYKKGDIIVLYTDGITEAKNAKSEEFGYERLQEFIETVSHKEIVNIQEDLINALYEFSGSKAIDDDYTTLIIKFT